LNRLVILQFSPAFVQNALDVLNELWSISATEEQMYWLVIRYDYPVPNVEIKLSYCEASDNFGHGLNVQA
jgi:hypothetical protein